MGKDFVIVAVVLVALSYRMPLHLQAKLNSDQTNKMTFMWQFFSVGLHRILSFMLHLIPLQTRYYFCLPTRSLNYFSDVP